MCTDCRMSSVNCGVALGTAVCVLTFPAVLILCLHGY